MNKNDRYISNSSRRLQGVSGRIVLVMCIIGLFATSAGAQSSAVRQHVLTDSALISARIEFDLYNMQDVDDRFKRVMMSGIRQAYEVAPDITCAFAAFDSLLFLRPDRPEGYFLKAAIYSSIYRFEPSEANFDSLEKYTDKTIEVAEEIRDKQPDNALMHFYLGGVYGNIGLYYLEKNSYLQAYFNGKKGKDFLQKCIELDPGFADANMGLGVYLYYADVLSPILKSLLFLVGMGGDKEAGLEKVKNAVHAGELSQVESKYYLSKLYHEYEGKADAALGLVESIVEQLPENLYYKYKLARLYYEQGKFAKALDIFQELELESEGRFRNYRAVLPFYTGLIYHHLGRYADSNRELQKSRGYGRLKKDLDAERYYRIGLNFDMLGSRGDAVRNYRLAEERDSGLWSNRAKRLIEQPLSDADRVVYSVLHAVNAEQFREAADDAMKALRNNDSPRNHLLTLLGTAYLEIGSVDEAAAVLQTVRPESFEDDSEFRALFYITHAGALYESGYPEQAAEVIRAAKSIDTGKLPEYYKSRLLASQYRILGEVEFR